jgi:hypothetical protein
MELKDAVITYLLRPRETVCFVDPRPPFSRYCLGRGALHTAFPGSP